MFLFKKEMLWPENYVTVSSKKKMKWHLLAGAELLVKEGNVHGDAEMFPRVMRPPHSHSL